MIRYCSCSHCLKNEILFNPYDVYEREFLLSEITLDFDHRTSALCKYDCKKYRHKATCPPNIPEPEYYKKVFSESSHIFIIGKKYPYADGFFESHWRNYSTNQIHDLLLQKEKELFKKGFMYAKSFIGGSCKACPNEFCNPRRCNAPGKGRVPLEATGLNVFSLMKCFELEYQEPPVEYFWRIGLVLF